MVASAIWLISRVISIDTEITDARRWLEVVSKCPVHRTFETSTAIVTLEDAGSEAAPRTVPESSGRDGRFRPEPELAPDLRRLRAALPPHFGSSRCSKPVRASPRNFGSAQA